MKSLVFPFCLVVLFLIACNSRPQVNVEPGDDSSYLLKHSGRENDSSQLKLVGVYEGIFPCADCEGIKTQLTLYQDIGNAENNAYILKETYLTEKTGDTTFTVDGKWDILKGIKLNDSAIVYFLNYEDPDDARYFLKVDDDTIEMLDKEQQPIASQFRYILTRKK